jgi:O-succinylbenzoate synthase
VAPPRLRFAFQAYRRALRVPVRTSHGVWAVRDGVLVRLEDGEGRVTWSEIAPLERFGTETMAGAIAWCASVGATPTEDELRQVPRGLPCCAAAIGGALLSAETTSKPKSLDVACLLPTGAEALVALDRARLAGFKTFKLKIGVADFATEEVHVARLIDCLPAGARLRLDANGGLDLRDTGRWLDAAAEWPVEFVEQPLSVGADQDLVRLAADHATVLALDESVRDADDIKRWRDRGWTGVFVIKPGLAGPIDELLTEVRIDPAPFVFSSALETAIGTRTGVRLAFAAGVTRALGFGVAGYFRDDGLGGGVASATISPRDLADWDLEAVWNRL